MADRLLANLNHLLALHASGVSPDHKAVLNRDAVAESALILALTLGEMGC